MNIFDASSKVLYRFTSFSQANSNFSAGVSFPNVTHLQFTLPPEIDAATHQFPNLKWLVRYWTLDGLFETEKWPNLERLSMYGLHEEDNVGPIADFSLPYQVNTHTHNACFLANLYVVDFGYLSHWATTTNRRRILA